MGKWLLRGLVFAALMVFVRLLQGVLINAMDTWALTISITLVVLFAAVAIVWGILDGRTDAQANPDPDRRSDLAMTWLLAGLVGGILSGLVSWFIAQFYDNLYAEALLNEITTFAAFTALVVFVAGVAGVAIGRYLVDRSAEPFVRQRVDSDRADTDVFEAVRDDQETVHAGATAGEETTPVELEKNS
jgi:MFS family permease